MPVPAFHASSFACFNDICWRCRVRRRKSWAWKAAPGTSRLLVAVERVVDFVEYQRGVESGGEPFGQGCLAHARRPFDDEMTMFQAGPQITQNWLPLDSRASQRRLALTSLL